MHAHHVLGRPLVPLAVGLAAVALAALGCTTVTPAPPRTSAIETYRVGPPDQLFVNVLPEPPIQRTVTVRPDGMITVDLIGDVPAAGRTTTEIAADIEHRIARFKRGAVVSVSVQLARSTNITVLGEVRGPTSFPLQGETRLIEAIGSRGGVTPFAAEGRVRIIRSSGGKVTIYRADLNAIERGDLSTNILLERGDIIVVPPTRLAQVGYAIQSVLFPLQQILGFGGTIATTVVTGGAGAGL